MMSRKSLVFLCSILLFCNTISATPLPDISADGAILIEAKTNTILYSKNRNVSFFPASTTKVLTSLAIAQDLPMNQIIAKTQESVENVPTDSSQIGLKVGDRYTVLDGLHAVLMASDNFVSYDLAVADSGSISQFANKMNTLATSIGATQSNFVNPHGYHDLMHYTTPYSLSQITKVAFSNPIVKSIAGTYQYDFTELNTNRTIPLTHTAALLNPSSSYYNKHVVAAKTGYHTPAGRTLVAQAEYDHIKLIAVVMRTDAPLQFEDMNKLFKYGSENFSLEHTSETGEAYILNTTYSPWAKPYIERALTERWIPHTGRNYTLPITTREFVSLLTSSSTSQYLAIPQDLILYNGNSIYRENLPTTRKEIAQVIYEYLSKLELIPISHDITVTDIDHLSPKAQDAILFTIHTNLITPRNGTNFLPDAPVSYEEALCIVSKLNDIVERYHSYHLPSSSLLSER